MHERKNLKRKEKKKKKLESDSFISLLHKKLTKPNPLNTPKRRNPPNVSQKDNDYSQEIQENP